MVDAFDNVNTPDRLINLDMKANFIGKEALKKIQQEGI